MSYSHSVYYYYFDSNIVDDIDGEIYDLDEKQLENWSTNWSDIDIEMPDNADQSLHRLCLLIQQSCITYDYKHLRRFSLNYNAINQVVVKIQSEFWDYTSSMYVGRGNMFYRVYRRENYIPKSKPIIEKFQVVGALTVEEMIIDSFP